jgi:3-methylcrotonyl-CoA carboxylase alpha subunit
LGAVISRLLVANRGEIAVRIARGAREMGVTPLGIYSDADADAYHLRFMDESARVGPAPATQSYLDIPAVICAARTLRADAVHPGYGFLSERAAFARAVRDAGLTFVGPSPEAIATMGSKIEAKRAVRARDVPTVPGYDGDDRSPQRLRAEAERIGFPVLIKASAGGGGRGMRVVASLAQFDEALESAKREALAAFGSDDVLLEKYLHAPRHIEFQILADAHGTTIHLGERECSIQRRHQKIVEEAPSTAVSPALRAEMGAAAVRAAQSVRYTNAGTCEFMLDDRGAYYFLEMNTRLQVEHPVTELAYGVDLVRWQLRIANGERIDIAQRDVRPRAWAVEVRLYAEDPSNDMLPSTGTISVWDPPKGAGVRLDAGVTVGSDVSVYYDPMLAKLICSGKTRAKAIARLNDALHAFAIDGVRTNLPLLAWIARNDAFRAGDTTTRFLEEQRDAAPARDGADEATARTAAAGLLANGWAPWRLSGVDIPLRLQFGDDVYDLLVSSGDGDAGAGRALVRDGDGFALLGKRGYLTFAFAAPPSAEGSQADAAGAADGRVIAPMPGTIAKIAVRAGDRVEPHALLLVLEAMKMEHRIEAPGAATVRSVLVREGEIVGNGAPLVELSA